MESFLKGESNDPQEILNQISFRIEGVYVIFSEQNPPEMLVRHLPQYDDSKYIINEFIPDPETRGLIDQFDAEEKKNEEEEKGSIDLGDGNNVLQDDRNSPNDTFQSAFGDLPGDDSGGATIESDDDIPIHDSQINYSHGNDSFEKHIQDVMDESKTKTMLQARNENRRRGGTLPVRHEPQKLDSWWDQKLLLLIEILGIRGGFVGYRNGKIKTIDDFPVRIKSIMVSTAMSLYDANRERTESVQEDPTEKFAQLSNPNEKKKQYSPYERISFLNYSDIVANILTCDFKEVGKDKNPLIDFLETKKCEYMADFLLTYLRYLLLSPISNF